MHTSLEKLEQKIENGEKAALEFDRERLPEEITDVIRLLLNKTQWFKTIRIENKKEELNHFREARKKNQDFRPNFKFQEFPYNRGILLEILEECRQEVEEIGGEHLERYGAKELSAEDLKELFKKIIDEIEFYIKLSSGIEDELKWRKYSENLWPMVDREVTQNSRQKLGEIEEEDIEKNISPQDVKEMFQNEVDRLEMDYSVETRRTAGCFNSPEEKTVVVAEGENGERMYSEEEVKMLTMHELFHAVRAYNGFKAGEESGFPEVLGLHTPFYDRAEEGGALYREKATETMYNNKEFDYHLRLVAAYELSKSDSFKEDFSDIAEKLIELGASEERAFNLLARNREALRHHIYLGGYHDWQKIENKEKMLIGKINEKWADRLWKETEAGGMIQKPEIGSEKLFDFTFKDSD